MNKILILTFLSSIINAKTVISIFDNQINTNHTQLQQYVWSNNEESLDGIDNDGNGLIDDINGWNFIDNTYNTYDLVQNDIFTQEIYKYYELRAKKTLGTISDEELNWYNQTRSKDGFKELKSNFTSYIHGTHIACLAMNNDNAPTDVDNKEFKFLPIRYLGEAIEGPFKEPEYRSLSQELEVKDKLLNIEKFYKAYAVWMTDKLELSTNYVKAKVSIVNASWGQSFDGTKKMVSESFKKQFGEQHSHEKDIIKITENFQNFLIRKGTSILGKHKDILFVFSAGNKNEDTDTRLHYPSSIVLHNVISVGASNSEFKKSSFSNFGKNTVSLFAPGEAIQSCDPNGNIVKINGTSQAAPQVTAVARILMELANVYDIKITPGQVKQIILNTVDKYDELSDQAFSSGILNPQRAYKAVEALRELTLDKAINNAFEELPNKSKN